MEKRNKKRGDRALNSQKLVVTPRKMTVPMDRIAFEILKNTVPKAGEGWTYEWPSMVKLVTGGSDDWTTVAYVLKELWQDKQIMIKPSHMNQKVGNYPALEYDSKYSDDVFMMGHPKIIALSSGARRLQELEQQLLVDKGHMEEEPNNVRVIQGDNFVFRRSSLGRTYTTTGKAPYKNGGVGQIFPVTTTGPETQSLVVKWLEIRAGLSTEKLDRFKNEALFCSRTSDPHIVKVRDHGFGDDGYFYVMPFYAQTLRDLMNAGIEPGNVLPLFFQVLSGLQAAHNRGITHRDIKPENILYDSASDKLILTDFGTADFTEEDLVTAVETKDGQRLANYLYAAPEQKQRGAQVGHAADVFAAGLILNEMFTKSVPAGSHFRRIASVIPTYSILDDVVEHMINSDPSARPNIASIQQTLISTGLVNAQKEYSVPSSVSGQGAGTILTDLTVLYHEKLESFRTERITKLTGPNPLLELNEGAKILLHLIPLMALQPGSHVDLANDDELQRKLAPITGGGWNPQFNSEGFMTLTFQRERLPKHDGYTQLLRTGGTIEAADAISLPRGDESAYIAMGLEERLIDSIAQYLAIQRQLGILPPLFIVLSFLNVHGYQIAVMPGMQPRGGIGQNPIKGNDLLLPIVEVKSYEDDVARNMKRALDVLWQSCGWSGSMNYSKEGKFQRWNERQDKRRF